MLKRCSGLTFKRSLCYIASKTEDKFVGVLSRYLDGSTQEHRLKCAVMRSGPRNAKLVSFSTPTCKQAFKTSLRYLGRYELSAVPVHRNEQTGIEIFRAVDYDVDDSTKVDVVLKFTKEMSFIENEIYARKKLDPKKVRPSEERSDSKSDVPNIKLLIKYLLVASLLASQVSAIVNTHATSTGFVVTFENVTTLEELLNANGDSIGKIEHKKAVKWTYAIAKCIEALHEAGMAHGEISAKNFGVNRQGFWKILSVGAIIAREKVDGEHEDDDGDGTYSRRESFGAVPNLSPVKSPTNKVHLNAAQAKDMQDFALVVCRLFGVKEEDVKDRTATARVQRKYRKAPMDLLEGCLNGTITASYMVRADFFATFLAKSKPSSTKSKGGKKARPVFKTNENMSIENIGSSDSATVATHTSSF